MMQTDTVVYMFSLLLAASTVMFVAVYGPFPFTP